MVQADPRAVIHEGARLGDGVVVEPFAVIGPDVSIGPGTRVGSSALVVGHTEIGAGCSLGHCAVVGTKPQDLSYRGERSYVRIGDRTTLREFVTVNRATGEDGVTVVGEDALLMAYVHIAHNCRVGNSVVLANAVTLAGHVTIEDRAIVGGMVPVHQFVRIGACSFIGGHSRVTKDVPPYFKAGGSPMRPIDINSIGLIRNGFPEEVRRELREAYRILYRSGLNTSQALDRMRRELSDGPEVTRLLEFVAGSSRGIVK